MHLIERNNWLFYYIREPFERQWVRFFTESSNVWHICDLALQFSAMLKFIYDHSAAELQKHHDIISIQWVCSARCICIACFIPISEGKPLIGQFKHSPPWCIAPAVYWPIRGNEIVCLHSWGDAFASCRTYPLCDDFSYHMFYRGFFYFIH